MTEPDVARIVARLAEQDERLRQLEAAQVAQQQVELRRLALLRALGDVIDRAGKRWVTEDVRVREAVVLREGVDLGDVARLIVRVDDELGGGR